uniref:Poly [ADP-ribose] polymerase n=1 Tax=Macrostomum lignano TaxID=282301 RepID=A0A1I8H7A7_9PLAT
MLESVFKLAKLVEELQSEPDQHSFFDFLHDSQCWIERTLSGVLDQSIPLETQEQQMKLMHELKKRQSLVIKVQSMGGKLAEENFGNKDLCAEIRKQIRDIGQKMSDLNEVVQQKMNDELRTFRCGHTERLDRESSLRRISDQFCSSCWPLASQVQANKLCQDGDRIRRTPVTADNEDTAVEYYKISDRVLRYALKEHNIKLEIRSIEKIKNPVLDKKLFNVYNEMHKKDCVPELLFHGTTRKNAEMIIQNGFKVGNSGMFGAGIYFATDSTKSAQYCRGTGIKSLLLCDVLLGKTMVCDAPKTSLTLEQVRTAGYDSVFARRNSKKKGGVLNDEYIVYRAEQATPRYLIKFGSECSIL